jgi:hypothetical protein
LAGLLILTRNGKIIRKLHVEKWYTIMVGLAAHRIGEQQFAEWPGKIFKRFKIISALACIEISKRDSRKMVNGVGTNRGKHANATVLQNCTFFTSW